MTWPYDCPHVSGERGAAWCRLLVAAGCPVYWRTGVCAVGVAIVLLALLCGVMAVTAFELVSAAMSALHEYQETL